MNLSLDQLDLLGTSTDTLAGAPLRLPLDAVDEDPLQPRLEFDDGALAELAASIAERGVLQPISVRRHPERPDRWMLNFGARRLRASRLANHTDIPAFVDPSPDSYDQVIENEQRDGLKPLELALFVQRRLAAGDIQAEIARRLSKSRQFVSMATALIDPPDWLLAVYRDGRCRGLNELHELRKLARVDVERVQAWVTAGGAVTRDRVAALRTELMGRPSIVQGEVDHLSRLVDAEAGIASLSHIQGEAANVSPPRAEPAPSQTTSVSRRPPVTLKLLARLDGCQVVVDTRHAPPERGKLLVRSVGMPAARAVFASELALIGLVSDDGLSI